MDLSRENPKPEYPAITGYQITGLIGRGGMGKVYRATDLRLGREVAVKTIVDATDEELVSRFETEARAIAGLDHPNIARMYDFTRTEDGLPACIMELVPGGSLAELIQKQPVSFREAAMIVETIARAVEFSHQAGIVHRDLKPGNILLSPDNPAALKVVDFGLAKSIKSDSRITKTGQILGTPAYMSPEQASGVVSRIGPAADIYSLGAMLYELIAGKPPFLANDPMQTMMLLLSEDPVAPRTLNPAVPRDLQTICLKCLEKKPARRFPSASALADDLSRWLNHLPIESRPASWFMRVGKWTRRNPWKAAAAGLVIALAIGSTLASLSLTAAYRETQSANSKLESRNEELASANRRTNAALDHARSTLDTIVSRVRNELYDIPQADALSDSTVREMADMYRKLLKLRPADPDVLRATIEALKIAWLNDWVRGRRKDSAVQVQELTELLDQATSQWPEDPWFAIERTSMESEQLNLLDSVSQPDQFRKATDRIDRAFARLLDRFPDSPDAIRAATAWQAQQYSTALNEGKIDNARDALRKRIELAERLFRAENPEIGAAVLVLAQALCARSEFELALRSEFDVVATLARAREVIKSVPADRAESRDVRQRLAEICRLEAVVAFRNGGLSAAESRFAEAADIMKRLVDEFPGDSGYRLDLASILAEQARLQARNGENAVALDFFAKATQQVQAVLDADPDNQNAQNLKVSLDQSARELQDQEEEDN